MTLIGGVDAGSGEVGLYASSEFDDPAAIVAYVEWGTPGHARSAVAVEAGVWEEGSTVPSGGTMIVTTEESPTNAIGWTNG